MMKKLNSLPVRLIRHFAILTILFSVQLFPTFGATNIDSLLHIAQKTQKSKDWNNVAEYYNSEIDTLNLRLTIEKSYNLAKQENNLEEIGRALILYSEYLEYTGKIQQAVETLNEAVVYLKKSNANRLLATTVGYMGYYYNELGEYDQAIAELKESIRLFRQIGENEDKIAESLINISFSFLRKNMPDSVIFYNQRAFESAIIAKDTITMIEVSNQLGILFARKHKYSDALAYYEEALRLNQLSKNKQKIPYALSNIAVLYDNWANKAKAEEFAQKAVEKAKECGDSYTYAKILSIAGSIYIKAKKVIPAIEAAKTSLTLLQASPYYQYTNLLTLAGGYRALGKLDSCEFYLSEAEKIHKDGHNVVESGYYEIKGKVLYDQAKYIEAIPYLEKSIDIKTRIEKRSVDIHVYNDLSTAYEKGKQDYRKALEYKKIVYEINDSIHSNEYTLAVSDFHTKYNTAEKELEITRLNLQQIQLKNEKTQIIVWLALIVILFLGAILYSVIIRYKKNTEKILFTAKLEEKENQYNALASDMEMKQIKYYLNGLEAERTRLAGELHDNVSNTLMGIELRMKTSEASRDELIGMLHDAHAQVRQISHELMPPVFRYASLPEILNEYVYAQNELKGPRFELSVSPAEGWEDLPQETALELYRIGQEACGNALKHAKASNIDIRLHRTAGQTLLTVSDNGRGMNIETKKTGLGLQIIKDRAAKMNGAVEIVSEPGKGTTIKITV